MGIYDEKVKTVLGQSVWDILERDVSQGVVNADRMRDIAQKLAPRVGGGHMRRMQGKGLPDWFEFREVLSDWYNLQPEKFESQEALETLVAIMVSPDVALPSLASELRGCLPQKERSCCSRLRAVKLSPDSIFHAPENLDSLCDMLCGRVAATNNSGDKSFDLAKSSFVKENYPTMRNGLHTHPDTFIPEGLVFDESDQTSDQAAYRETCEAKMFDFLQNQFEGEDCFIFQNFDTSIDQRVVKDFCDQLSRNLESDSAKVETVEEQLEAISRLIFLDLDSIKGRTNQKDGSISACKEKIALLQRHSKTKRDGKGFLVVNLTLATIVFVNMGPENEVESSNQMQLIKKYLEELLVPDREIDWTLIGFEVCPGDASEDSLSPRCEQCSKHVLVMDALNQNLPLLIEKLHKEEGVIITSHSRRSLRSQRSIEEKRRDSYAELISNIVVLANMDLVPHSHAVEEVMKQLSGTNKQVVGPSVPAASEKFIDNRKIIWNKEQKKILSSRAKKMILQSDFGCGKSFMLHRMIQGYIDAEEEDNFIISFLPQEKPYVRSVLDIVNRMHYKDAADRGVAKVISVADILQLKHALKDLSPKTQIGLCFHYLRDLTKSHKHANIVVDEVPLQDLINQGQIHARDFAGSLWIAVSSVSKYDFRDLSDKPDLSQIPAAISQNFKQEYLRTNMRNGGKIVGGSLSLQDGTIEKGAIPLMDTIKTESARPVSSELETSSTSAEGESKSGERRRRRKSTGDTTQKVMKLYAELKVGEAAFLSDPKKEQTFAQP